MGIFTTKSRQADDLAAEVDRLRQAVEADASRQALPQQLAEAERALNDAQEAERQAEHARALADARAALRQATPGFVDAVQTYIDSAATWFEAASRFTDLGGRLTGEESALGVAVLLSQSVRDTIARSAPTLLGLPPLESPGEGARRQAKAEVARLEALLRQLQDSAASLPPDASRADAKRHADDTAAALAAARKHLKELQSWHSD